MEEMKVIHHQEFGTLNIAVIDGKEYFPATACAKALGYKNPKDAVAKHCKEDSESEHHLPGIIELKLPTNGGVQKVKYISEGNLYRLIMRSRLPSAQRFKNWVFDEVFIESRRTGSYGSTEMETIREIMIVTVREMLPQILKEMEPPEKKPVHRAHGKINKLLKKLRRRLEKYRKG